MDKRTLSLYLSRILSGQYVFTYNNTIYKLVYPDINLKYEADLYAQQEYDKSKFNDWLTDESIVYWLIDAGLWSFDSDKKIEQLENQIDNLKVDLYNSFLNPSKTKNIRRSLDSAKKQLTKLINIRHSFDHLTISGYCELLKNQYIIIRSLRDTCDKLIFKDDISVDYDLVTGLSNIIAENIIDIICFREIARNEMWRGYWSANKDYIFDKPIINWTDEQRTLVVISKMYDSAYEHPECPTDEVIEDDDMLDGWMILQRREHEKHKSKNRAEKMLKDKKIGNAKEVFLVANSKQEIENIYNLNDPNSMHIIKERNKIIQSSPHNIQEIQLPDVQRDLQAQNNQQFLQSRRK